MMQEHTNKHKYRILWIDDKYEAMSGFVNDAWQNGIDLRCYKSQEEGLAELRQNYQSYDGVLLDVFCFVNKTDKDGEENKRAFYLAKEAIAKLDKKFELFVFTGQEELFKDDAFEASLPGHEHRIYRKGRGDDQRLFKDLKEAANQLPETQLRRQYATAFAACKGKYLGKSAPNDLLALLKWLAKPLDASELKPLNTLRQILESLNQQLQHQGLVPSGLTLNQCKRFLDNKEFRYRHTGVHYHPTAVFLFAQLVDLTQDASHSGSIATLRLKTNDFIHQNNSTQLAVGAIHHLLELLAWFGKFLKNNPNKSENLHKWEENWQEAEVIDIKTNGWATAKLNGKQVDIPKARASKLGLQKGDKVKMMIKPDSKPMIDKIERLVSN